MIPLAMLMGDMPPYPLPAARHPVLSAKHPAARRGKSGDYAAKVVAFLGDGPAPTADVFYAMSKMYSISREHIERILDDLVTAGKVRKTLLEPVRAIEVFELVESE